MNNGYISANASYFPRQPVELLSDNSECDVRVSLSGSGDMQTRLTGRPVRPPYSKYGPVTANNGADVGVLNSPEHSGASCADDRVRRGSGAAISCGPLTPLTHDIGPPLCVDLALIDPPIGQRRSSLAKADAVGEIDARGRAASSHQLNMVEQQSAIRAGAELRC